MKVIFKGGELHRCYHELPNGTTEYKSQDYKTKRIYEYKLTDEIIGSYKVMELVSVYRGKP